MNIAMNTAVTGLLNAHSQAGAASASVVDAAAKGEDIIQAIIAVKRAEVAQKASAEMVKIADDMMHTVLDIIA